MGYDPVKNSVRAELRLDPHQNSNDPRGEMVCVRGGDVRFSYGPKVSTTSPECRVHLVTEFDLSGGDRRWILLAGPAGAPSVLSLCLPRSRLLSPTRACTSWHCVTVNRNGVRSCFPSRSMA